MEILQNFFIEPFHYSFMVRALIVGISVSVVCAALSCLMILKGWSLLGDAISHAVLPGIAMAYVCGIPLLLGAFLSGLLCVLGIGFVKQQTRVKEDTVIGILFTGFFAVGLILLSKIESEVHLMHILFGSLLGITGAEMAQLMVIAVGVLIVLLIKQRDLKLFCFDPDYARSIGINVRWLHFLLLTLLALTIVVSLKTSGMILVISMLITPGATAYLLTDRFQKMILIAISTSVISTFFGICISFKLDASTSGLVVLFQAALFLLAFLFSPRHGLLAQRKALPVSQGIA
jgi:manganese transport system permease protein